MHKRRTNPKAQPAKNLNRGQIPINFREPHMAKITASVFTSHVPAIGAAMDLGKTKEDYWKPVFAGYDFSKQWMKDNKPDVIILVFNDHADLWKKIEKEVKEWTLANWGRWEVEKPVWFDENFKACVPDDFIPKLSLEELKGFFA